MSPLICSLGIEQSEAYQGVVGSRGALGAKKKTRGKSSRFFVRLQIFIAHKGNKPFLNRIRCDKTWARFGLPNKD